MKKNFLIFLIVGLALFFLISPILAQDVAEPKITVKIGSFDGFSAGEGWTQSENSLRLDWIGQYIGAIYTYGVGVAAILAAVMIMIGGFMWLASAGNPNQISTSKDFIISALAGLLLALFSFIILQGVNPQLVKLEGLTVPTPQSQAPAGGNKNNIDLGLGDAPNCGASQPAVDLRSSSWSCVSGVTNTDSRQLLDQGLMSQDELRDMITGAGSLPLDSSVINDVVEDIGFWQAAGVWVALSEETQQGFLSGNVTPELMEQAYTEVDQGVRGGVNGVRSDITLNTQERIIYTLENYDSEVASTLLRLLQRN